MNIIEKHMVEMPDGVKLFTIVQRPPDTGRAPVIFQRGPYENKEIDEEPLRNADLRGYCIITQHCRGTALSEGDFIPYDDERRDGLATLEWIRRQPFYGGEIYLQGVSYTSAVHLSYLSARPADVRGGWLNVMETERYNIVYRNGVLKTGLHGSWSVDMYKRNSILRKNFVAETFLTHPLAGITPYIFGEEVWLDFELAPHAYWLEPGDRLRLDVSSSCFPHFLPHTNRCGIQALQTGADIARNTIVLGCSSMTLHENTQG